MNEFDLEVSNLDQYINKITEIRKKYLFGIDLHNEDISNEEYAQTIKEPLLQKLYFRGQANKEWEIFPNVFRDNGLSCEAAMTNKSYLCSPEILFQHRTPFERLTLLQHYGLGTRLLDITANPFVALYFACQSYTENEHINPSNDFIDELTQSGFSKTQIDFLLNNLSANGVIVAKKKDGAVYFKAAFAENFNKTEIQILSYLAEIDVKQYPINDLVENLVSKNIITQSVANNLSKNHYSELIKILQSAYFVESNFSNQRLIKQDGSFLISGNINVKPKTDNWSDFFLEKASGKLNGEFEKARIIIPEQHKCTMLRELDSYNINERSLFPEIDHQLRYIQEICREHSKPVTLFYKFQSNDDIQPDKLADFKNVGLDDNLFKEYFDLVKNVLTIDWEKSESIKANVNSTLKRYLLQQDSFSKDEINKKCEEFYAMLHKKYSGKTFATITEKA